MRLWTILETSYFIKLALTIKHYLITVRLFWWYIHMEIITWFSRWQTICQAWSLQICVSAWKAKGFQGWQRDLYAEGLARVCHWENHVIKALFFIYFPGLFLVFNKRNIQTLFRAHIWHRPENGNSRVLMHIHLALGQSEGWKFWQTLLSGLDLILEPDKQFIRLWRASLNAQNLSKK